MIICHCNQLTKAQLDQSISALLAINSGDPKRKIKPQAVHANLGCRSRCCGCYPELKKMIIASREALELAVR